MNPPHNLNESKFNVIPPSARELKQEILVKVNLYFKSTLDSFLGTYNVSLVQISPCSFERNFSKRIRFKVFCVHSVCHLSPPILPVHGLRRYETASGHDFAQIVLVRRWRILNASGFVSLRQSSRSSLLTSSHTDCSIVSCLNG